MGKVFAKFREEVRKRSRAEGIAIGKEQGIAIGEKQGIAIGKEQGIVIGEEQTKLAFVSSMLANGCSQEDIVRLTSLPPAEVQALARRRDDQAGGCS